MAHALERAGEAIASAGGAVIVAFMALVLSSLGIFRAIGPALAIAVAVTLVASLTLVPAIVTVLGRALFWPSKKYLVEPEAARFAAVGASLARHPGRFALVSGGTLGVLTLIAFTFTPTSTSASRACRPRPSRRSPSTSSPTRCPLGRATRATSS